MAKNKKDKDLDLPIYTLDCETDPFLVGRFPQPFIWGLYGESTYRQFSKVSDVVEFLRDKKWVVYAHNGGKFDYHFMIEYVTPGEPVMIVNGRLVQWKIGECEMRDSYSILPVPLAAYKKDDFDYKILEKKVRHLPENWTKIERYLKNDCVYLYEFVSQFIDRFGRHLTMAGASMATWETMRGIPAPKTDQAYYEFFSPYYYGGRVQCFQQGAIYKKFRVADINSAYPRAMLDRHPIGKTFERYAHPSEIKGDIGPCFISLNCISKGAFPLRKNGKLYFPADDIRRTYHITGWEYLTAIETNTILDPRYEAVYQFAELADFKDYILHFFNSRQEAKTRNDKAMDIFCKLFMNALYGKFAANPQEYDEYIPLDPLSIKTDENGDYIFEKDFKFAGTLGPFILSSRDLPEYRQRFYNVATGASITGWVRAYLWRAICASDGVLYCDTDSIAAEKVVCEFGDELGQWKDEGGFDEAHIAGKKFYAFKMDKETAKKSKKKNEDCNGWKQANKGVNLEPARIKKAAAGKPQTAAFDAPTYSVKRPPSFLKRTVSFNAADISVVPD